MFEELREAVQEITDEYARLEEVERVHGESAASAASYDLDEMVKRLGWRYYRLAREEK